MTKISITCQRDKTKSSLPETEFSVVAIEGEKPQSQLRYCCPICNLIEIKPVSEDFGNYVVSLGATRQEVQMTEDDRPMDDFVISPVDVASFQQALDGIRGPDDIAF